VSAGPRVLHVGPLPPTPSGVADYAADLLPHLAELVDLTAVVADDAPWPTVAMPFRRACELPGLPGLPLHQLGNHRVHAWQLAPLAERPGVVLLHDALLHHLHADVWLERGRAGAYLREVVYDRGSARAALAAVAGRARPAWDREPLIGRALDRARGLIVHSRHAAAAVLRARPRARVWSVHHGVAPPPAEVGEPPAAPFVVGSFGGLTPEKRVATLVAAFARLRASDPGARLLLVGERSPALPIEELLAAEGVADAVELTGRVDLAEMERLMRRCHVCVQLRWPTAGEASGVVLRALRLGRPTVVSDHGWFGELPADAVARVGRPGPGDDDGAAEVEALAARLLELRASPAARAALGAGARAYTSDSSWSAAARRVAAILAEVAAAPDQPPAGRFLDPSPRAAGLAG
jgi:glycosyltransferase involved in cell wall biosynthesis